MTKVTGCHDYAAGTTRGHGCPSAMSRRYSSELEKWGLDKYARCHRRVGTRPACHACANGSVLVMQMHNVFDVCIMFFMTTVVD